MILRKPYALLIKNFRKINIVLLLLTIFILWKSLDLYSFVENYIDTGIYNTTLDSINNYVNIFSILAFVFTFIIALILAYLLKYKNKPYLAYIIILIANAISFVLFLYVSYYFTFSITGEFELANLLIVRDLIFISTIPYYPIIFLLLIRSIGLDLKKFGFGEDKEFININEEDREEVEVEVSFDKDKFFRQIKNKIRLAKYFFLEHKLSVSVIIILVISLLIFNVYQYLFVENRIYEQNQSINKNGYRMIINNTYITDRDYTGNIIDENVSYLILDTTITNKTSSDRVFDANRFYLYMDTYYFLPSERFNTYFVDMGNLYTKEKKIKAGETQNLLFVYQIKKQKENSNFLLTYQTPNVNKNATRISIKVVDINDFITKGSAKIGEEIEVPINLNQKWNFSISNFQITDSINYRYQECNATGSCPIYESTLTNKENKTILYLKFSLTNDTKNNFLAFLKKYGKVRYTINGEMKEQKIKYQILKYRGDYVYLELSNEIKSASRVQLVFTVRSYQYFYELKGE